MRIPHGPYGFGLAGGIFADILAGLMFIICFIVVVGLLFVLVRFLLVATKAAEIYVARNGDSPPAVAESPAVATSPTTVPTATRSRATKTPPAS
jgi:uncharacterized membrane protein